MQERYPIDTPENVTFAYEVAGLGSRLVAAVVDHLLIFAVWFVMLMVAAAMVTAGPDPLANLWFLQAVAFALLLLMSAYYIVFELLWDGQSPGKRLIRVRVLHVDGTPMTLVDSIVRNLVRWIDFLPALYGLGVVVMFISRETRRLGDYAAGTVVVKERVEVTLESLAEPPQAPAGAAAGADWPLERLSADDYELLADYLRRRRSIADSSDLARRIAGLIARKLGLEQTDFPAAEAEAFLQQVAAAYRARAGRP